MRPAVQVCCVLAVLVAGCNSSGPGGQDADAGAGDADAAPGGADAGLEMCGTPAECAAGWEQNASDRLDAIVGDPVTLAAFLRGVPKGGDLHNHLTGAVYAETYLAWALADGDCVNSSSFAVVSSCAAGTQAVPTSGMFYDQIVGAWSMEGFVAGVENGHDHFFATFGKYGLVAGAHRDEDLADIAGRAADENEVYIETMFNLGKNVGNLAAADWTGTLTAADLPALYATLKADPQFAAKLASDVAVVTSADDGWHNVAGCNDISTPAACDVTIRYVAQISRTGANDVIFGQLVSAFEMGAQTSLIVGANLSSPEDDTTSINNYDLHMAMLDFLYQQYTMTAASPLGVTLHAGELSAAYLPVGSTANTFHIRKAVEIAHATRIGHGLDVMSETDPSGLMDEMHDLGVLVEVCLSSNDQILEISGTDHPLAQYLAHGVPVALATDDQGVSRSSMAGEYQRAVLDQGLDYRQLKTMARQSLEHAFISGASLWTSVADGVPVAACAPSDTMWLGDAPDATCQQFLDGSERARLQWELERRFVVFERAQ